jgi:integration host factor subunit beta
MTKSDLINAVAEKAKISEVKAESVVNGIFEGMAETLISGGRIEIRGFGSFIVKEYAGYDGRNPSSGELVKVQPKKLPFFKVGKELKEMVDNL